LEEPLLDLSGEMFANLATDVMGQTVAIACGRALG